jgi:predicted transcriptional regulator of viral defense system
MPQSIELTLKNIIKTHKRGWCFSAMDFSGVGNNASIRKALSSLHKQKFIRRLTQGIYDYPKLHKSLGIIPPDLQEVAEAIAKKNGVQIQPSGALAANLVGLSEQVPARLIFLTEGPSRKVTIGNQEIIFRKTTRKIMAPAGTREGLVIQAFKNLGKDHIDKNVFTRAQKFLAQSSENEIRKNIKYAPLWIRTIIFEILGIKQ